MRGRRHFSCSVLASCALCASAPVSLWLVAGSASYLIYLLKEIKLITSIRLIFGSFLYFLLFQNAAFASDINHPEFVKRLSEVGLTYSLPTGFIDNGANISLEKKLSESNDSKDAFVVHKIGLKNGEIEAYLDVRPLKIDLNNNKKSSGYALVFEFNAQKYCSVITGGACSILTKFPKEAVKADYKADFGMLLRISQPDPSKIGGHKRAMLFAISKSSQGIFYITVLFDSEQAFQKYFEPLMYSLKFN